MLNRFADFARQHIVGTLITAVAGTVGLTSTAVVSLYEAGILRQEEMKVAEFNALMAENAKFLELLQVFTEEVATNGVVDVNKRRELSSSLGRFYTGLTNFTVNLPAGQEEPVLSLRSSVNEVKKRVQMVKAKDDLDPLSVALVDMFQKLKLAKPLIERAVGKPSATPT